MLIEEVDRSVRLQFEPDLEEREDRDDSLGDRITIARALSQ